MGHGKALTNDVYWWIIGLHDGGVSLRDIARRTRRSPTCVRVAIKTERGPATDSCGGDNARSGRQPAVTEREVRLLVRTAASGAHFATELKTKLRLKATVRTAQQVLQRLDHLVYTKMDRTLPLTAAHKATGLKPTHQTLE
ncbi:hypothetical protein ON010_g7735 [Phytophthora cinnamomi]|nr:hypothetical protein ON010_g7735 [Phytophthora cinnamomi]